MPNPCHYQDYDRSMSPLSLRWAREFLCAAPPARSGIAGNVQTRGRGGVHVQQTRGKRGAGAYAANVRKEVGRCMCSNVRKEGGWCLRSKVSEDLSPRAPRQHWPVTHHLMVGSYLRLVDSCITQHMAQGPSRTCNEFKEEGVTHHLMVGRGLCGRVGELINKLVPRYFHSRQQTATRIS